MKSFKKDTFTHESYPESRTNSITGITYNNLNLPSHHAAVQGAYSTSYLAS